MQVDEITVEDVGGNLAVHPEIRFNAEIGARDRASADAPLNKIIRPEIN